MSQPEVTAVIGGLLANFYSPTGTGSGLCRGRLRGLWQASSEHGL